MKRELNFKARDSIVNQITKAMDDLRIKKNNMEMAFDYYDQARNSSYTESMEEVKVILEIVSKRLDMDIQPDSEKATNLAGVADQIHYGERGNGNKD